MTRGAGHQRLSRDVGSEMKTRGKAILISLLVVFLTGALWITSMCRRSTTRQYRMTFATAETRLLEALHLDKTTLLSDTVTPQAKAEGDLTAPMSMKLFDVYSITYVPGRELSFTADHIYDIMAAGGQFVYFDLTSTGPNSTRITVNFTDGGITMFPPFFYLDPGTTQEGQILDSIWGE